MSQAADPISKALGIYAPGWMPLVSAVNNGLPLSSLDRVANSVAPADKKFAYRIVSPATLTRRRKAFALAETATEARLSREEGARLARLASVWTMALDVWGGSDDARRFMFDSHPLLDQRRPVDVVLESEFGRPLVEGILGRLQYGSAV